MSSHRTRLEPALVIRPPALGLSRAQLAGHESPVGLDLVAAAEARGLVDGRHEGRRRHRPDVRHALQAAHPLVCRC